MQHGDEDFRREVVLSGRLAEFRTALEQEIDAARRHEANSAVPLVNGRRIGQIGSNTQYVFAIENALNLPGDAPADLELPDRQPIEVSVVSVDGMAITLSVPEDLGSFVRVARLRSNLTLLMRRLIQRIEEKAQSPNPVGDRLLGASAHGSLAPVDTNAYVLNREQHRALATSLGFDATFIQGPPGTGKSRTIGAIATELMRRQRTVLIASHTNVAVDQALLRMNEHLDDEVRQKGLVVRVGDPKNKQLEDHPDLLLSSHVERRSRALVERRTVLEQVLKTHIEEARGLSRMIELCEWVRLAEGDIHKMRDELKDIRTREAEAEALRGVHRELESQAAFYDQARRDASHAAKTMATLVELEESLRITASKITQQTATLENLGSELSRARSILGQTCVASWLVRKWKGLPSPEEQTGKVQGLENTLGEQGLTLDRLNKQQRELEQQQKGLLESLQSFQRTYGCDIEELVLRADTYDVEVRDTKTRIEELNGDWQRKTVEFGGILRRRLGALAQLGLADVGGGSLEDMLAQVEAAHDRAVDATKNLKLDELLARRDKINPEILAVESELRTIEEDLKRVEELVIRDARVVATTLTRSYLRDSIQGRTFDTVIVDEASMAPIPAVWVAASLATSGGVAVGDPKQLPPIVISTQEPAKTWLGRDIFEAAGITDSHPSFVHLTEQYRMHPSISAIVNSLIYDDKLTDAKQVFEDKSLGNWYNHNWGHDCPVLLVDTGCLNAWVTSVPRGRGSSRLNFLSASVCLDIVAQTLRKGRPPSQDGQEPHILIVSPYRPHARLLEIMIDEQKLNAEVRAGTAHSFQGSEAEVVIFDLVNDEPQWRVAMFMRDFDRDMRRLLNVAISRAKQRLIVVGDFNYIKKCGKKAFLGNELIPFLDKRYPKVSALDVVKKGLAARAAQTQTKVYGGGVVAPETRIVVTQEDFDRYLRPDLGGAKRQIVIYSPFLTESRLSLLEPQFKAATERGVCLYVVTKPYCDRSKREVSRYRLLENSLHEWGVVVIHKRGMHEKLIFIDDDILWEGSLNPLSFRDTVEHMERRVSKKVFDEYARTIRLSDLVDKYAAGSPVCPICGGEVIASEGRDEPYFWRCASEDCDYKWSIDEPGLKNGMIACARCGGPVEYGEWGGKPAWRCRENRHHHQKIAKSHLRLPKMLALIPAKELRKVRGYFGLTGNDDTGQGNDNNSESLLF